mmetsp:Transcript_21340/g.26257  ORF Transcript_21340/g.26257 Transcript_21340/m.26257 type:complete len:115 (-) Transcript_21340:53-397(-)
MLFGNGGFHFVTLNVEPDLDMNVELLLKSQYGQELIETLASMSKKISALQNSQQAKGDDAAKHGMFKSVIAEHAKFYAKTGYAYNELLRLLVQLSRSDPALLAFAGSRGINLML